MLPILLGLAKGALLGLAAFAAAAEMPEQGIQLARLDPGASSRSVGRLPSGPLSEHDAALYRQIFRLQKSGAWTEADQLIARLRDPVLLGHVQYQRYMHPTAYRSRYDELHAWLEAYGDHPDADRVHALARKRRPAGAPAPQRPTRGFLGGWGQSGHELHHVRYRSKARRSAAQASLVATWQKRVESLAERGQLRTALSEFERGQGRRLSDKVEADIARWHLARGYFRAGADPAAFDLAARAAGRSGRTVPEMHWTAGIAAWRLGRIETAAEHFASLANSASAHAGERSRAAFWAARAHVIGGKPHLVGHFLGVAADHGRDFYGLLARAVLGEDLTYAWEERGLKHRVLRALMRPAGARRAMALGQIGEDKRAEREIRKLASRAQPELMSALIALAGALDLPATQMRLAQRLGTADGRHHYGALYPLPVWQPADGLRLDRALLFAIIRAESAFNTQAVSRVGALGLMQVMPGTAKHITRFTALKLPRVSVLLEPETCMAFGQAYLEYLLRQDWVGDNLIYMAIGYNAGPGRVLEWRKSLKGGDDPLLFLESLPLTEPRVYVKKVLANLWTYRARLGQPQPSLEALAAGQWPRYRDLDPQPVLVAQN